MVTLFVGYPAPSWRSRWCITLVKCSCHRQGWGATTWDLPIVIGRLGCMPGPLCKAVTAGSLPVRSLFSPLISPHLCYALPATPFRPRPRLLLMLLPRPLLLVHLVTRPLPRLRPRLLLRLHQVLPTPLPLPLPRQRQQLRPREGR